MKASYGHVMDLPKKTIGILLPGEQDGNAKKKKAGKAASKGKAEQESAEEEDSEAIVHHVGEDFRADLRSDSRAS